MMVYKNMHVGDENDLNTAPTDASVQSFGGDETAYLIEQRILEKKIWDGSRIERSMSGEANV